MSAVKSAEHHGLKRQAAAIALMEGVGTFSQAASSQRKRKRGVSSALRSGEATSAKLDVKDLDVIAGNSRLRNSLKGLVGDIDTEAPSAPNRQKLSAPTPHTTQVRLNRQEAYSTTKETLDKWIDAVKSTRSAEQLIFPLRGKATDPLNNGNCHLSRQVGRTGTQTSTKLEDRIARTLSLAVQTPKPDKPIPDSGNSTKRDAQNAKAKTAHLRMERELLLRKEAKAKRLRKIKSKSYRRLLRKDQQRLSKRLSSPENINNDEAEEASSESGNFLRGVSTLEQSHDVDLSQSLDENTLSESPNGESVSDKRLFAMKFMEEAEKRNAIRNRASEISTNQESPTGRRIFHDGLLIGRVGQTKSTPNDGKSAQPLISKISSVTDPRPSRREEITNPWLPSQPTKGDGKVEPLLPMSLASRGYEIKTPVCTRDREDKDGQTVWLDTSLASPTGTSEPLAGITRSEQPELLARAFAGDNILQEIPDQPPKHPSPPDSGAPGLQGWGNWSGLARSASKSRKQRGASKQQAESHKARTEKVVLNQKLCKKGTKYLATALPYPFETSDQYERSLRFPIGQEWSTKETHQTLTAPKVIVKGGTVIAPLS
ncbi:hypothetical protein TWF481_007209 [Arthrobotrys musiformis]|uniref:Uncharacterized protein n=1 Tax=Arthrobotrys musiformis TaxID=47236 RepID=A0AAV9WAY0_9PEZI